MRQRLCSNSGHHRATIEALAIKSSRGTRSVYTDRFEYVALQSRMCKRGGCGRAARQSRFSFRKSNEANFGELVRGCIYVYMYVSRAILDFGRKKDIDRILIWMDFFLSIFDKYKNCIYIWKIVDMILWIYWRDCYYILAMEWKRNWTFQNRIEREVEEQGFIFY